MSEITDKLRDFAEHLGPVVEYTDEASSLREAADYIDRLETALRLFTLIDFDRGSEHDEQVLSDAIAAASALTPVAETPNQEPTP